MARTTKDLICEIRRYNPNAAGAEIARALGISKQAVSQHLKSPPPPAVKWACSYEEEVKYVREVIPRRGCIWEGARPAFESGEYESENLARMLREGVIVPASDPEGGYVLPA